MKWFRLYNDILDDPKVQKLPPKLFKFWINILCLASKNGGKLPPIEDIAFAFRTSLDETKEAFHACEKALLITRKTNQHSTTWAPHNWAKRQYKSDTSTERVKRFRNAQRNNVETPPESDTEQSRTEQNQKKIDSDVLSEFDIKVLLDDKAIENAKKAANGYDIYNLIPIFNKWIAGKKAPDNPAGAFIKWCSSYTKKNKPSKSSGVKPLSGFTLTEAQKKQRERLNNQF